MSSESEKSPKTTDTSAARHLLNEMMRCGAIPIDTATCADSESERANNELREELAKRGGFPVKGSGKARDDEYCKEEK